MRVPSYLYNPPVNPVNPVNNTPVNTNDATVRNVPTRIPPPFEQIQNNGGVQIRKNNPMLVDDISPFPTGAPASMPSQPVRVVTPQTKNPKAVDTIQ